MGFRISANLSLTFGIRAVPALLVGLSFFSLPAHGAEVPATGVVRAQDDVTLKSEVAGIVWRIVVEEGEPVREGQLLVELKNDRERIGVELARANLLKAKAAMAAARVSYENAAKELSRAKIAGDALPRKELEDREDAALRLRALLELQEAELEQAMAEMALRENELRQTRLVAPFAGTVTRIYVRKGDAIKPLDTQVLELVALDQLYVEVVLPVGSILQIRQGQKVKVLVEAEVLGSSGTVEGKVSYVNPKVDAASRTFLTKVVFSDNRGNIRPGMLARVIFGVAK